MNHTKHKERTFVMIKPDGIQRSLIGEIIKRFESVGLKLVAMKMVVPSKEMVEHHYLLDSAWKANVGAKALGAYEKQGKTPPSTDPIAIADMVLHGLKTYMSAGPVVAMVWEGVHAVGVVRKLIGSTEPLSSDVGTIRGDYTIDSYELSDTDGRSIRNLIHASGSVNEANMEIKHWFNDKDLINYRLVQEAILYDINLDGMLE